MADRGRCRGYSRIRAVVRDPHYFPRTGSARHSNYPHEQSFGLLLSCLSVGVVSDPYASSCGWVRLFLGTFVDRIYEPHHRLPLPAFWNPRSFCFYLPRDARGRRLCWSFWATHPWPDTRTNFRLARREWIAALGKILLNALAMTVTLLVKSRLPGTLNIEVDFVAIARPLPCSAEYCGYDRRSHCAYCTADQAHAEDADYYRYQDQEPPGRA